MCEVVDTEEARIKRDVKAQGTVIRRKICLMVRTCRRNGRSVIKKTNQLDIDWKASSEHFKIQWVKESRNKIFQSVSQHREYRSHLISTPTNAHT